MISKEQRVKELHGLLECIGDICTEYNLRVGQLLYCVFKTEDIFNLENEVIHQRIETWVKEIQCTIK